MSTIVKIRSSNATATPAGLVQGEMAYTANGGKLFIMANGALTPIGGFQTPGTLTANQAIVTDANNMIDKVMWGNTTVNAVVNSISLTLANSTVTWSLIKPTAAQVTATNYFPASDGTWKQVSGGTTNPQGSNTNIQFNDSGAFNGTAGLTFDKTTNVVFVGNVVTLGNSTINASLNSVGLALNGTQVVVNNSVIQNGANVIIDTTRFFAGNSSVNAYLNSTSLNFNGAVFANATGTTAGILYATQVNTAANISITSVNVAMTSAILSVKDVNISGNLTVSGTMTTVDSTSIQTKDSMIKLADQNASNVIDIGFYGLYNNGSNRFTGLAWQASSSKYILWANNLAEPTTTIDTANASFSLAILNSYLQSGGFTTNSSAFTATANSTWAVNLTANTLTLSSPLATSSGGTGLGTIANQDLLVGNSTGGLARLAVSATVGALLQSDGTNVSWNATIDGGTF